MRAVDTFFKRYLHSLASKHVRVAMAVFHVDRTYQVYYNTHYIPYAGLVENLMVSFDDEHLQLSLDHHDNANGGFSQEGSRNS